MMIDTEVVMKMLGFKTYDSFASWRYRHKGILNPLPERKGIYLKSDVDYLISLMSDSKKYSAYVKSFSAKKPSQRLSNAGRKRNTSSELRLS